MSGNAGRPEPGAAEDFPGKAGVFAAGSAPVNRILKSSIVDGPGNRAAVFLQGCGFNCRYCHNSETISLCRGCGVCVDVCPAGALSRRDSGPAGGGEGEPPAWDRKRCVLCDSCIRACPRLSSPRVRLMGAGEVMAELGGVLPFIRGVTVSGGECTRYPAFLRALGRQVKDRGLSFFLDSNGDYPWREDGELLSVADGVMLDVKADPDNPDEYRRVTGNDGAGIRDAAEYLASLGRLYEIRTVVSPGLFDAENTVRKMCRFIAALPAGAGEVRYKLIRYRPLGVREEAAKSLAVPDDAYMEKLAAICAAHTIQTVVI